MEGGANSFWLFLIDHTLYHCQCTYLNKDLWGAEQPVCCYFSPTLSSINPPIVILSVSQMYHFLSYLMSLHLLFPLPGVLCLQITEWFPLCFIQVSAYMLSIFTSREAILLSHSIPLLIFIVLHFSALQLAIILYLLCCILYVSLPTVKISRAGTFLLLFLSL